MLNLSYTARDAGGTLRVGAERAIEAGLNKFLKLLSDTDTGLVRAISLRQEFPDVLQRLLAAPNTPVPLTLLPEHFPFFLRSTVPRAQLSVPAPASGPANPIEVHAVIKADADPAGAFAGTSSITLTPPPTAGTPSTGTFSPSQDPRVRVTTVSKGTNAELLGGEAWTPEAWTLSQTGLAIDKIQDLVLLVNYTVDLPDLA